MYPAVYHCATIWWAQLWNVNYGYSLYPIFYKYDSKLFSSPHPVTSKLRYEDNLAPNLQWSGAKLMQKLNFTLNVFFSHPLFWMLQAIWNLYLSVFKKTVKKVAWKVIFKLIERIHQKPNSQVKYVILAKWNLFWICV